jgi:hypothetical protein
MPRPEKVRLWMIPKMIPSDSNTLETVTRTCCADDSVVSGFRENGSGREMLMESNDDDDPDLGWAVCFAWGWQP